MQTKQSFALQAVVATVVLNAILLGAVYFLAGNALQAANLTFMFFAIGVVITLILCGIIYGLASRVSSEPVAVPTPSATATPPVVTPRDRVRPPEQTRTAEAGAIQMLAILQREGRLIDFLQEDLGPYDDAQIGAAVRNIHAGCKQALVEHVKLQPVFEETEGSTVTVRPGFDIHAVRLTGDVVGEPPFTGALQHRGWRATSIDLPRQASEQDKEMIVAAAEVEVAR